MNLYRRKQRWKLILTIVAALIVFLSLWQTNKLVRNIEGQERERVKVWAEAVKRKAALVKYTEVFFEEIKNEERKRVELWAEATKRLIEAEISTNEDLTFYSNIISGNTSIPVILTNESRHIIGKKNVGFKTDTIKVFEAEKFPGFDQYPPLTISFGKNKNYLYYKDSKVFSQLKILLDDIISSFLSEVAVNSASVPVIIVDSVNNEVIAFGNIDSSNIRDSVFVERTIQSMKAQNNIIEIELPDYGKSHIYYKNSYLLTQLKYYPLVQFLIIGLFLFVSYLLFSTFRNAEQNQVWAGMAKETAHQLGTPIMSLAAWLELLKLKGVDNQTIQEIGQDLGRLENITARFSNIGSPSRLSYEDIGKTIQDIIIYFQPRVSKKVQIVFDNEKKTNITAKINVQLFGWVMENLIKNSIDAMNGKGMLTIDLLENTKHVIIDITDTGKGLPKNKFRSIFNPGYTSKQRGWGLGLSLAKRIIETHHKGKIFVKQSIPYKMTTFRILLKK